MPVTIDSVTLAVLVATVLPAASWTATTGWTAKAAPEATVVDGAVVKASLAGGPAVIVIDELTAAVSVPEETVSV